MKALSKKMVYGVPVVWFFIFFVIIVTAMMTDTIPNKLMGGFALTLILGMGLYWIGDQIPVVKDFGGGIILAVLLPAILAYFGIIPASAVKIAKDFFTTGYDYTTFLVPSLLVGSILGMERNVLISAGSRFMVAMVLTIVLSTIVSGVIGLILGYGMINTMLFVAGPILGAGVSASAVPLSEIYASYSGKTPADFITLLTASVIIANVLTILTAAWLASIGKKNPNFLFKGYSGEGKILRREGDKINISEEQKAEVIADSSICSFRDLQTGFATTCAFYVFGSAMQKAVPSMHAYLWMILPAIIFKITNICPSSVEKACGVWGDFFAKVCTPCLMVAVSLAAIDIGQLIGFLGDPRYAILCVLCVFVTVAISGLITYFMGFYFVEGSIMTGLGLADMGGSGDIAVLTAANRMNLLPFLTICSRVGGALNMAWCTFVASQFL
jgi:Na+/citrate or Na+/malate symporter